MLICDKCGKKLEEGSKFCSECGDIVNEADYVENKDISKIEDLMEVRIICPLTKCKKENIYQINKNESNYDFKCNECNTEFKTFIANVRSKKTNGDKKYSLRKFSIRVKDFSGNEEFIEFENKSYEDFELKSKDLVAFSTHQDKLKIIQNLTINRFMELQYSACYIATYLYGNDSYEVKLLRYFRDNFLLTSTILKNFVTIYYKISPILIKKFGNNKIFAFLASLFVFPIVFIIKIFHK